MSLLTDLRQEVIDNIGGIATDATPSGLGLESQDTIHAYLYEWGEDDVEKPFYLSTQIGDYKQVRAYGVQVTHEIAPYSQNNVYLYLYTIQVELYYPVGETGVNNMINAFFAISQEIINGQVPCLLDNLLVISDLTISKITGEAEDGEFLQGIFTVEGEVRITIT